MDQKEQMWKEVKQLREDKKLVAEGLGPLKDTAKELLKEIDGLKSKRDGDKQGEKMSKKRVEEVNLQREGLRGDITRARMEKDRLRDKYY